MSRDETRLNWYTRFRTSNNAVDWPLWWRRGFAVSGVLLVVFAGALIIRNLNLGIEFEGGVVWEVDAPDASVDDVRSALRDVGQAGATIQVVGDSTVQVRSELDIADPDRVAEITGALADLAGVSTSEVSFEDISPSWGSDLTSKARTALIVFFIVISIYITLRLEWRMAVAALVAVIHDILVTVGVYALFQFEVTSATVIAFLTILGYSLYDTMIVFDKIRENEARLATASRMTATDLTARSLNQVLTRAVNTTFTSVMPILAVLVIGSFGLGAVTLREFAIALLVGLMSGTYSSLFVATPIVAMLKEREPRNRELAERLGHREPVPAAPRPAVVRSEPKESESTKSARPPARSRPSSAGSAAIPPRPRKKKRRNR